MAETTNLGQIVDPLTGELLSEIELRPSKKARYTFPGGYGYMGLVDATKLSQADLSALGFRLIWLIISKMNYGGLCNCPNSVYARELGTTPDAISRQIRKLHDLAILHRIGPRAVFMSPLFFFRGTADAQRTAIEQWAELRRMRLVKTKGDIDAVAS